MADALCGPSNPLQQFKQQTQLDRTLQQDRLTSRYSPSQGFRSANPNAGLLDPEFEAFQAGLPAPDLPLFHQQPPSLGGPSQAPSWANDFQQLHISSPPTFQQQQSIPRVGQTVANWSNGFQEHIVQNAPRQQSSVQSPQAFQQMARYGSTGFRSNFAQPSFAPPVQQSKGKEAVTEQFDEAAFERAFDQARDDMMADTVDEMDVQAPAYETGASTGNYESDVERQRREAMTAIKGHQRRLSVESQRRETQHEEDMYREQVRLLERQNNRRRQMAMTVENLMQTDAVVPTTDMNLNDSAIEDEIAEEEQQEEQKQREDDDALAATAQELLEKVEHNQTDKFRNSQFLGLMRKLRDREMKVEGNNMVETAAAPADLTEEQWRDAIDHTADPVPRFNNSEQTPYPLEPLVDTRPLDYTGIPAREQDLDAGRFLNPDDGQEVVDLLDRDGPIDDIGTSSAAASSALPEGVFYGDLRARSGSEATRASEFNMAMFEPFNDGSFGL